MGAYVTEQQSLWEYLAQQTKPVVLYGMGDGAVKIMEVCKDYGIPIRGIFASDEFVRGHSFMGYPVERLSQLEERLGEFIVLLAFGVDYDEMIQRIFDIAQRHELYAPDVPVFGGGLFTHAYYLQHQKDFDGVYERLADAESRRIFANMVNYKISGKLCYLADTMGSREEDFGSILQFGEGERYLDLGAYDGDTVLEFTRHAPQYRSIIALEPDTKNYKKLLAAVERAGLQNVTCHNLGSYSHAATLTFANLAGRNSALAQEGKKLREVQVTAVDTLLQGAQVTYIKMDVEGAEEETLRGCRETLQKWRPKLSVAAYHRNSDLFLLPQLIWQLQPDYRLYLRRHKYIPAWEILLYGI